MTIGYIGLGKMGKNMVLRLLEQGIQVVAWNRSPEPLAEVVEAGATGAKDLADLVSQLRSVSTLNSLPADATRSALQTGPSSLCIWLMLPAGSVTDEYIDQLVPLLKKDDLLIDGANSFYKDTLRRAEKLSAAGIRFMDVAVSGGPSGARNGACLMIGGEKADYATVEPLLQAIAAPHAYAHLGSIGAGHFAKMVHNGIEYAMMEAIGEGVAVLEKSSFSYDLAQVMHIYQQRSVIESRLVGWAEEALRENPTLSGVSSTIAHSGEGEWTVQTAQEMDLPIPVIEDALNVRKNSSKDPENIRNKVVTALRGKFGGHSTSKQ